MEVKDLKIAIYGAGAMGTVLGGLLTLGGLKGVHLITRNEKHTNGLNERGAQIVCKAENRQITVPVTALLPSQMTEKYDIVFLMTKQKNNAEILQFLLPYLHEESIVCTTQNGLPEQSVANIVGEKRTYGGVASFGATFVGDGKVELTSKTDGMSLQVAGYHNDGEKTELLKKVLSYAGNAIQNENFAQTTDNLSGARWSKLCINAAFSSLSALTGLTFGQIARRRKTRKLALAILREGISAAKSGGVELAKMQGHDMEKMLGGKTPLKRFIAYLVLPFAMRKHKKLHSGMLKDIQNGKRCEIDFVLGAVCRESQKTGVETPVCDQALQMIHGIENGLYETDYKNVDFFDI